MSESRVKAAEGGARESDGHAPVSASLQRAGCSRELCERMARLERRGRLEEGLFELASERDRLARAARRAEEGLACVDEVLLSITTASAKGRRHGS